MDLMRYLKRGVRVLVISSVIYLPRNTVFGWRIWGQNKESEYAIGTYFKVRSTGLWRWYINITITIMDIIHRPVFYLKLSSTLQGFPYLTGNTCFRYEPNRLMLFIGLWRWYINITITILDIIHRPVFYLVSVLVRRQRLALSIFLTWVGSTWIQRQNPVSETSCFK
jgi:hypothetical protein